ncbi:rnhA, partial [Mucuna pruriens]
MAFFEYDITYVSRNAIKGSALAEHLAYYPLTDPQPLCHEFPNEHIMVASKVEPQYKEEWTMWFDGASNVLRNGIGVVLASPRDQCFPFLAKLGFDCTNNMAEYEACAMGLIMALEHQVKRLRVYGDSTLVIYQLRGEWETRDAKLIPYRDYVKEIIGAFDAITFHHVPREKNQMDDALATLSAMVQGKYPEEASKNSKRTLRRLVVGYLLSGAVLYKRNMDMTFLRCVDHQEAERIIEEVHEGTFDAHANGHGLARKILRARYYWTKLESNC